jgi:hypothetical protein
VIICYNLKCKFHPYTDFINKPPFICEKGFLNENCFKQKENKVMDKREENIARAENVVSKIKTNFDELFELMTEAMLDHTIIEYRNRNTCLDCLHWNSETEFCLKFDACPPVKIIVNAERDCPGFDIDIPF